MLVSEFVMEMCTGNVDATNKQIKHYQHKNYYIYGMSLEREQGEENKNYEWDEIIASLNPGQKQHQSFPAFLFRLPPQSSLTKHIKSM